MAKVCAAPGCNNPVFSHLYCKYHQRMRTDNKKPKGYIPAQSEKKKAEITANKQARIDNGGKTDQERWYEAIMQKEPGVCWETREKINKQDRFGWHGSVCHILAKKQFPSVATHPLNYLILKMWGGTHDKTHRWDTFSKMKVWKIALQRIKIMYPILGQEEKRKLPDFIRDQLES